LIFRFLDAINVFTVQSSASKEKPVRPAGLGFLLLFLPRGKLKDRRREKERVLIFEMLLQGFEHLWFRPHEAKQ
jgi:hypothetical protein